MGDNLKKLNKVFIGIFVFFAFLCKAYAVDSRFTVYNNNTFKKYTGLLLTPPGNVNNATFRTAGGATEITEAQATSVTDTGGNKIFRVTSGSSVTAKYENVGTYNGEAVDVEVVYNGFAMYPANEVVKGINAQLAGFDGSFGELILTKSFGGANGGYWSGWIHGLTRVTANYTFYKHGTSTKVKLDNSIFSMEQLQIGERIKINNISNPTMYVSSDTLLYIDEDGFIDSYASAHCFNTSCLDENETEIFWPWNARTVDQYPYADLLPYNYRYNRDNLKSREQVKDTQMAVVFDVSGLTTISITQDTYHDEDYASWIYPTQYRFGVLPTLTINYYKKDTTEKLSPTVGPTDKQVGEAYSVKSPEIDNYHLVNSNQSTVSGTMPNQDKVINVYYEEDPTLTINYYKNGTTEKLSTSHGPQHYKIGYKYSINSPKVTNYHLVDSNQSTVSGTMPSTNKIINVYYDENPKLTIEYLDKKTKKVLDTQYGPTYYEVGETYKVDSKSTITKDNIKYGIIDKNQLTIGGVLTADRKYTVLYSPLHKITTGGENLKKIDPDTEVLDEEDETINYVCKDGYYVKEITVDGRNVDVNGNETKYTFKKVVQDHDIRVICNENPNNPLKTVNKPKIQLEEPITYETTQKVDRPDKFFDRFEIEDTLEKVLEVNKDDIKVYNESKKDVTNLFRIYIEDQTILITAKDTKVESFYNHTYKAVIGTKIKKGADLSPYKVDDSYIIPNVVKVRIDNNVKSSTVSVEVVPYKITTEVVNGIIDEGAVVSEGANVTIKYSPWEGYVLKEILVDGKNVDITKNKDSYTFENIKSNHHIKVVYKVERKIETEVVNGEIDPSVTIEDGTDVTIKYKPNPGYVISYIEIDGEKVNITNIKDSYTFKEVRNNHKIKVVYEKERVDNPKTGPLGVIPVLILGAGAFAAYELINKKNKIRKI